MIQFKAQRKGDTEILIGDLNHIDGLMFVFPRHEGPGTTNSPDYYEVDPATVQMLTTREDGELPELLTVGKIWDGNIACSEFLGPSISFNDSKKGYLRLYVGISGGMPTAAICELNELAFNRLMGWIWPVWEKFRALPIAGEDSIMEHHDHCCDFLQAVMGGSVSHIFAVIVKCVEWFNRYIKDHMHDGIIQLNPDKSGV